LRTTILYAGTGELLNWLVTKFEQRLHNEGERDDGQKVMQLVAGFRNSLRTSLQVSLAKGQSQMLRAAGCPHMVKAYGHRPNATGSLCP
jgi:hypothetical protein